jgi:hypothetical protein
MIPATPGSCRWMARSLVLVLVLVLESQAQRLSLISRIQRDQRIHLLAVVEYGDSSGNPMIDICGGARTSGAPHRLAD